MFLKPDKAMQGKSDLESRAVEQPFAGGGDLLSLLLRYWKLALSEINPTDMLDFTIGRQLLPHDALRDGQLVSAFGAPERLTAEIEDVLQRMKEKPEADGDGNWPVWVLAGCLLRKNDNGHSAVGGLPLLAIPATLSPAGALKPNPQWKPFINGACLSPGGDGNCAIGERRAEDDYHDTRAKPDGDDWRDWWSYGCDLFEAVTGQSLADFSPPEGLPPGMHFCVALQGGALGVNQVFAELYAQMEAEPQTVPALFRQLATAARGGESLLSGDALREAALRHSGHIDGEGKPAAPRDNYPLDSGQRLGVQHFLMTRDGELQAINGPPGTGKTSLLRDAIASYWVNAAREGRPCPIIVATSAGNMGVTNIIDSFHRIAATSENLSLAHRWLPAETGFRSYGLYYPSKALLDDPQSQRFNLLDLRRNEWLLRGAAARLGEMARDADGRDVLERHWLDCFTQLFPGHPAGSIEQAVDVLRQRLVQGGEAHADLGAAVRNGHPDIVLASARRIELRFSLAPERAQAALERLMAACGDETEAAPALEAFLDCTLRTYSFHLAARLWEGRFLLEARQVFAPRTAGDTPRSILVGGRAADITRQMRLLAMLCPCLVATNHKLPQLFLTDYRDGRRALGLADVLIYDEAGQGLPPAAAAAFALARRAIVVGDVRQLEPVCTVDPHLDDGYMEQAGMDDAQRADLAARGGTLTGGSVMRMASASTRFAAPGEGGILLRRHYRCRPSIIQFCNELMYDGQLTAVRDDHLDGDGRPFLYPAVSWIESAHRPGRQGTSWINSGQAGDIADWLADCRADIESRYGNVFDAVALLTPFKEQGGVLTRALLRKFRHPGDQKAIKRMKIGTVHALQGAERPIVVYSLVTASGPHYSPFVDGKPNLLNVAVSRAKDSLIVFGDPALLIEEPVCHPERNTPTARLGRYLAAHGRRLYPDRLVVVESRLKSGAIQEYLGRRYQVLPTDGHFRELPWTADDIGLSPADGFKPRFRVRDDDAKYERNIAAIARELGLVVPRGDAKAGERLVTRCTTLILGTDDDTEGEAIAWHVLDELKRRRIPLDRLEVRRMRFHSIDAPAVLDAAGRLEPGIDWNKVRAALARAVIDRVLGVQLSARVSRQTGRFTGFGRVQAGLVDLIDAREREVREAGGAGHWTVEVTLDVGGQRMDARLTDGTASGAPYRFERRQEAEELAALLRRRGTFPAGAFKACPPCTQTLDGAPEMGTAQVLVLAGQRLGLPPDVAMRLLTELYEGGRET